MCLTLLSYVVDKFHSPSGISPQDFANDILRVLLPSHKANTYVREISFSLLNLITPTIVDKIRLYAAFLRKSNYSHSKNLFSSQGRGPSSSSMWYDGARAARNCTYKAELHVLVYSDTFHALHVITAMKCIHYVETKRTNRALKSGLQY
jgi:hypothetical protein